ncbi:MAG: dihydroorotase [Prevotellaceae bacterium]|jgi:dihydroorotase|nr:dihydroorotase [Prevotellaceae bacterium]
MESILIKNAQIINEGASFKGSVLVENGFISRIFKEGEELPAIQNTINATDKLLIPGVIDDQVHFREPGLTHKADIYHESRAALAGGVTSFMDMPNAKPPATTLEQLEEKYELGKRHSAINYSFYFGVTNDNAHLLKDLDIKAVCGVKVFMGSSTGNMLVDDEQTLTAIFSTSPLLVATHCEDEATIRKNTEKFIKKYGDNIPFSVHPLIRSRESCYKSSYKAVELAKKYNTRLHVLHITTADELQLFAPYAYVKPEEKRISAEACVHHLWYSDEDYETKGSLIKCNPAIKTANDRKALQEAVAKGIIDVVATDHAPHTLEEKDSDYLHAPSGLPLIQLSLSAMLELFHKGVFSLETIVERMCHAPARLFGISKRGFIREGYHADISLVDLNNPFTVERKDVLSKCGWSPFEGQTFRSKVSHVLVNGRLALENGKIKENIKIKGEPLAFDR